MPKPIELTDAEIDLLVQGLNCRSNFIQTGDPVLCQEDLRRQKREKDIKTLSVDQMRLLVAISDLVSKLRQ